MGFAVVVGQKGVPASTCAVDHIMLARTGSRQDSACPAVGLRNLALTRVENAPIDIRRIGSTE